MARLGWELGKAAYTAYGKETDNKNYQGLPMPTWDELPLRIKNAWQRAAQAAVDSYMGEVSP